MKIRHLILLLLRAEGDKFEGKTLLQKEMYFISIKLKRNLGFRAHYYGPYSPDVEQGMDELIGAGFVDVEWNTYGIDSDSGFEMKKYTYVLTESGKKLADALEINDRVSMTTVRGFVEKLEKLGSPNYQSLSLAAKAYFILQREGGSMNKNKMKNNMLAFGWNVRDSDIESAIGILNGLKFIKEK